MFDTNQDARATVSSHSSVPTLINDRILVKIDGNSGKTYPNGTMSTAHAEIGAIQQAFDSGMTSGQDMSIAVSGRDVCGYCLGDIAAAAEKAGLGNLEVKALDNKTGLPKVYYWVPGMRSLRVKNDQ